MPQRLIIAEQINYADAIRKLSYANKTESEGTELKE